VAVTWTVGAYFRTLGVEVRRGRAFDARDTAGSQLVVVVSHSLAERYWPGQDPIGRRLKWGFAASTAPWFTIVGVADDVHEGPLGAAPMDHVYQPHAQLAAHDAFDGAIREMRVALAASGGDAALLTGPALDEIHRLDPSLAVADVGTMRARVAGSVTTERLTAVLLAAFAAGALVLAALGLYGVLALAVAQRTAEIGLRLALGAERGQVIGLVVGRGIRLTLMGLVIGLGGALALGRFVASLLYETTPYDPATLGAVTALLLAVSVGASVIPAWRASRIDPIRALRVE
jgi:putative ABC transport system permease protein